MDDANKYSLTAILLEESHDSHGGCVYGSDVRYAQVDGEQYVIGTLTLGYMTRLLTSTQWTLR
jgi:hypothetical protein